MTQSIPDNHRFLDEAGDTTFYGKGKTNIIGDNGVSKCFILGMVKFKQPLGEIRQKVLELQNQITQDPYFADVCSVQKKISKDGFFFHATDDVPEIRKILYDYIQLLDCSFEAVVGRKIPGLYEHKHNGKEAEFYADMLSHLLKNKLAKDGKLILNIADRGQSTRNSNLQAGLDKAISRSRTKNSARPVTTRVVFNVQNHYAEPLLNVADYFCWAVQRVFERGEMRYYNYLRSKISLVVDLYDEANYANSGNYYTPRKPLQETNRL